MFLITTNDALLLLLCHYQIIQSMMSHKTLPVHRLLLKEDAEILTVFQTALTHMGSRTPISLYRNIESCLQNLKEMPNMDTPILFFYLNKNVRKCTKEIATIRKYLKSKDLSIIVYDSKASSFDEDILKAGANIYIKKSNNVIERNKVLQHVINRNWQFEQGCFNRETYVLSV
jgi:hypothetical protein